MLRRITLFILVISVLVVSCKKGESKDTGVGPTSVGTEELAVSGKWEMGYALRVNTGLYTLEEDTGSKTDKTKWTAGLSLGESIMVGNIREATFSGDNKVYDFVEIRDTNGREGYAFTSQVAAGGRLAVVTDEKAMLYKTPKAVDVTGNVLSRKIVLVYYPETKIDDFVEIRAYDSFATPSPAYRNGNFVRLSALSEKRSDIQASILLQTALPLRDSVANEKARKDALLESALLDYPDSVFNSEIFELVNPAQNYSETSSDDNEGYYLDD